jgi:hypothetical protein
MDYLFVDEVFQTTISLSSYLANTFITSLFFYFCYTYVFLSIFSIDNLIISFMENVRFQNILYCVAPRLRYVFPPSPSYPMMIVRCAYSYYNFVICWIIDVIGARAF